MNRKKIRKQRLKKVNVGKGKKLNLVEAIALKVKGFCDGRQGLPRQIDHGEWYAPFIDQEVNSFEEFCSHIWGSLQIENERDYSRLQELIDGISQKKDLLEKAREELTVSGQIQNDVETVRKKGEDKLTEAQVRARRNAEREKRLAPLKSKTMGLEQELNDAEEEFAALHSKLIEDDNTTRLICQRVRDHIRMRLDVYWNSALRRHPEGVSMPMMPLLELEDKAENTYIYPHEDLMKRAAAIYDEIPHKAKDKEAA